MVDNELSFLPIGIRIDNANILLIGGGKVATHKASILSRFTSHITIVGKEISADLKDKGYTLIEKAYEPSVLEGHNIVYICTNDHVLNRQIVKDAHDRGLLINVCDKPTESDFVSPAISRNGNLTIAVASDSKDVKRSIRIRNRINELIDSGILKID